MTSSSLEVIAFLELFSRDRLSLPAKRWPCFRCGALQSMRITIADLLLLTTVVAVLTAVGMQSNAHAVFLMTFIPPWLVVRWIRKRKPRRLGLAFLFFAFSLLPLYAASMGPYFYLGVNFFPKNEMYRWLGSIYAPMNFLLDRMDPRVLKWFMENYLIDWISIVPEPVPVSPPEKYSAP